MASKLTISDIENIRLPHHRMRDILMTVSALVQDTKWAKHPDNKKLAVDIFELAKHPYYRYLPYMNRSNGNPSWQWNFMMAAGDYKGRVAFGANRIGKTKQGAYEAVLAVTGRHPAREFPVNGRAWIIGLDNAMIRDIDRPLFDEFLLPKFRKKFYKKDNMWLIEGDGREWTLVFKSTEMGGDKFQGENLNFIWFDEEPKRPDDIWNECELRLTDSGGIWWMTATPVRGTKWLKNLSERADVYCVNAGMADNPYIPIEEINKLRKNLNEDEIAVRIDGDYVIFGGRPVFDRGMLRKMLKELNDSELVPRKGTLILNNNHYD